MATRTIRQLTDDLQPNLKATQTIYFSYRGQDYKIDLNGPNSDTFDRRMQRYIEAGTKINKNLDGEFAKVDKTTTSSIITSQASLVRNWAQSQGMYVNPRGSVPQDVWDKYEAYQAHLSKIAQTV